MKVLDTIHGRIVNVDIDVDSDYDGDIDDADEPLEETQGGFVGVGAENLTPIRLSFGPLLAPIPGKLTLSATKGGDKIRIWKDAQRTTAVPLPKVWQNGVQIPPTLYVEGVTPSANVRDVELTLEYDEVPEGTPQDKQYLFKCSDKIALTVVKVEFEEVKFADFIGIDGNTRVFASFQTNENIHISLSILQDVIIPTHCISWKGANPGHNQSLRLLSKANLLQHGELVTASFAGSEVFCGKFYVFEAPTLPRRVSIDITVTRDDSVATTPFGVTKRDKAFSPSTVYKVHYKDKNGISHLNLFHMKFDGELILEAGLMLCPAMRIRFLWA